MQVSGSAWAVNSAKPELVSYIFERECKVNGAVFKIAVCGSGVQQAETAAKEECISANNSFRQQHSGDLGQQTNSTKTTGSLSLSIDVGDESEEAGGECPAAELVVSWIMDVVEREPAVRG